MADDRLKTLLQDFCDTVGLYPVEVLRRRQLVVKGIDVVFTELPEDEQHCYAAFQFGALAAGRSLKIFRLMLESNVLVYAKELAVMGMDTDSGGVVLTLRIAYGETTTGSWLADNLAYFAEHAIYWKKNIMDCADERFNGITSGTYTWIQA
jgi:Tir chaperone protein (CesT) family